MRLKMHKNKIVKELGKSKSGSHSHEPLITVKGDVGEGLGREG
jgi:hypothetical protein